MDNANSVKVGDNIIITNAEFTFGDYENGQIMKIRSLEKNGVFVEDYSEDPCACDFIFHEEYEIAEDESKN